MHSRPRLLNRYGLTGFIGHHAAGDDVAGPSCARRGNKPRQMPQRVNIEMRSSTLLVGRNMVRATGGRPFLRRARTLAELWERGPTAVMFPPSCIGLAARPWLAALAEAPTESGQRSSRPGEPPGGLGRTDTAGAELDSADAQRPHLTEPRISSQPPPSPRVGSDGENE